MSIHSKTVREVQDMVEKSKSTILIVDDDAANTNLLVYLLQDEYTMLTTRSGYHAINVAMNKKPNLIILAAKMPGMSGYEVIFALQHMDDTKSIPIILIADSDDIKEKERLMQSNNIDYIQPGLSPELIKEKIASKLST